MTCKILYAREFYVDESRDFSLTYVDVDTGHSTISNVLWLGENFPLAGDEVRLVYSRKKRKWYASL